MTNTHNDDRSLIAAAAAGDRRAFIHVIRRYDEGLRAWTFSMTASRSAMDAILHTTYKRAYLSLDSLREAMSPKSWIYRIAYETAMDELRRRTQIAGANRNPHGPPPGLALDAAIQSLSVDMRAIVLLVDGSGFDHLAAAEILDVPPTLVASRLEKARGKLRAGLAASRRERLQ